MTTRNVSSRRQFLKTLSGGGALLLAGRGSELLAYSSPSARDLADRYGPLTRYSITRKGKRIGTHEVRFTESGGNLSVAVESKIRVTVMKIPVFTFNYVGEELWVDDQLTKVTGTTTENKSVTEVAMQNDKESTKLVTAAGVEIVDRLSFASNHWNFNVTDSQMIFNTITGKASVVHMQELEPNHFQINGEIQANVWYDDDKRWSRLSFLGSDGSQIDYRIE